MTMVRTSSADAIIEQRFSALLDEQIWVCWSEIERDGRRVKLPLSPVNGRAASVAQPGTWARYTQAKTFRRKSGVGLVLTLTAQGRLIGIDLDSCRHPETGAVAGWATEVIDAMASYTEISPSGSGFKIFAVMTEQEWQGARMLLSRDMRRLGASWKMAGDHHPPGVELYLGGRYFTVTGREDGARPVRKIACEEVSLIIRLCEQRFKKAASRSRTASRRRGKGVDQSESGRAFRVCLAAVREGVPVEQVPQWAARLARTPGHADWVVSEDYWLRRRNEGTQLQRDYSRAMHITHRRSDGAGAS